MLPRPPPFPLPPRAAPWSLDPAPTAAAGHRGSPIVPHRYSFRASDRLTARLPRQMASALKDAPRRHSAARRDAAPARHDPSLSVTRASRVRHTSERARAARGPASHRHSTAASQHLQPLRNDGDPSGCVAYCGHSHQPRRLVLPCLASASTTAQTISTATGSS